MGVQENLQAIFYPESVAIVGASNVKEKWGATILTNLLAGGFEGSIYPVNLREREILGMRAYRDVKEIPGNVDMAFITTPSHAVREIIDDCVERGIKGAVIITSGFSEIGEEGETLEDEVVKIAKKGGMSIVGPNTMGILCGSSNLSATRIFVKPQKGGISFISQSGNLGVQLLFWAMERGLNIEKFIGSGNEGDLHCEDFIEFLYEDQHTKMILLYLEGLHDGSRFINSAKRIVKEKPIIALKAGRTNAGKSAALSHTGTMSGSMHVYEACFKQSGVIMVSSATELMDLANACGNLPLPKGNKVAVVSMGGGWGVLTADACNEHGLELPSLTPDLITTLDQLLPSFWSKGNPIDLVGVGEPEVHMAIMEKLVQSHSIDSVIFLGTLTGYGGTPEGDAEAGHEQHSTTFLEFINYLVQWYEKPIVCVPMGSGRDDPLRFDEEFRKYVYPTLERAASALAGLSHYSGYVRKNEG